MAVRKSHYGQKNRLSQKTDTFKSSAFTDNRRDGDGGKSFRITSPKLFKRKVGLSPVQYVKDLRLEQAREMLVNSFLQIREIGFKVGMSDQSHFIHDLDSKENTA